MTNSLALIRGEPAEIIATLQEGTGRIRLPIEAETYVHAPYDGWQGLGFRIAAIGPAEIPPGKRPVSTGAEGVELVDGEPTWILEDQPPAPWPELSQRQFWKVLALAGMHADVMSAVDALPLEDQIEAKQALTYRHDHWLIQATRPAFGLDDAQFRDLWFWGASL